MSRVRIDANGVFVDGLFLPASEVHLSMNANGKSSLWVKIENIPAQEVVVDVEVDQVKAEKNA